MRAIYPVSLVAIFAVWATHMTAAGKWPLFSEFWSMSVTMAFGSFVAGSTPAGGGAVAFPVFTKLLMIPEPEARTFGMMIQSVGMTMAAIFILSNRIAIYAKVFWAALPGGILGLLLGLSLGTLPSPYPRILFTCLFMIYLSAMLLSRWFYRHHPDEKVHPWMKTSRWHFFITGIIGGLITSMCGSGIDILSFIVMSLAYGMHEKRSIPTSVILMAALSLCGFFMQAFVFRDITVEWDYWLVCVPIVAVGAPLGAYVASIVSRKVILAGISLLILCDFATTMLFIPLTGFRITVILVVAAVSSAMFWLMLRWRQANYGFAVGNGGSESGEPR